MAKVNSQDFSSYNIYEEVGTFGNVRVISTNGVPDHPIGIFPIYEGPDGIIGSCGRPDGLMAVPAAATYYFLPVTPTGPMAITWDVLPNTFGIAVNGVPLDPLANEWWSGRTSTGDASLDPSDANSWLKNAPLHPDMASDIDNNMGHIQPPPTGGDYHYHALPTGLYEHLGGSYPWNEDVPPGSSYTDTDEAPIQLGWGWDGVPVYGPTCYQTPPAPGAANWSKLKSGWTLKTGSNCRPSGPPGKPNGDYHYDYEYTADPAVDPSYLDECNGHTAAVSANGTSFYHYHITEEYPYIPRCWMYPPKYSKTAQGDLEKEASGAGFTPSPTPTPTPTSTPRQTPTPRPPPIS